jgi:hypothetical protein
VYQHTLELMCSYASNNLEYPTSVIVGMIELFVEKKGFFIVSGLILVISAYHPSRGERFLQIITKIIGKLPEDFSFHKLSNWRETRSYYCHLPPDLFELLVKKGLDPYVTRGFRTCLTQACEGRNSLLVDHLLKNYVDQSTLCTGCGPRAILISARLDDLESFNLLLPFVWNANSGVDGDTPPSGENLLMMLVKNRSILKFVKLIVESKKIDINAETRAGWTALNFAVRFGTFETCEYLVEQGGSAGKLAPNLLRLANTRTTKDPGTEKILALISGGLLKADE